MLELIKTEMGNAKRRVYSYRRRREGDWSSGRLVIVKSHSHKSLFKWLPPIQSSLKNTLSLQGLSRAGERGVRGGNDPQS